MNKDEIIRMAREAGSNSIFMACNMVFMQRFAALVVEDYEKRLQFTRERWEIECASQVEIEREACAKVCEGQITGGDHHYFAHHGHWDHMAQSATNCAAAIRARAKDTR
jgi:hypothetical protein